MLRIGQAFLQNCGFEMNIGFGHALSGQTLGLCTKPVVRTGTAMLALLLIYASWQVVRWGPTADRESIADFFFYLVNGGAVGTAYMASRRCAYNSRLRRAWRLFALAFLAQLAGQVAFQVYDLLGRTPYPSIADVLYLCFYPLMLAGLLSLPVATGDRSRRVRLVVDLAVVTIAGSAAVVYLVLGPTVVTHSGSPLQVAFSIAYPVGDMVLLVGLGSMVLRGSAPSAKWALRLLGAGLALFVIGDLVYGYITLHSTYKSGDPIDAAWMVALALMAIAGTSQQAVSRPEQVNRVRDRVSWLPPAAVAFGFGLLVFSERREALFPGFVMTGIAIVLAGLVLARQVLVQNDLLAAQGQLRHQAFHDALTGLPNRLLVLDRAEQLLARARRNNSPIPVLLFLDIDGFKHVNDSFGHAAGDKLLQIVATRLTRVIREGDTIGRLGGDEFVILLDPTTLTGGPELVAERVLAVLHAPVDLGLPSGQALSINASIGMAKGTHLTADELLRDADIALYRAKGRGKSGYVMFESGMKALAEDDPTMEADLRVAINEREFFLLYQPTFDLQSGVVTGVEALIRWRHPSRGVIAPEQFIPLAEATDMIAPIGRWVLNEACSQAAKWRRSGYSIGVAVNVSVRQLDSASLLRDVAEALSRNELDPGMLTLEITEAGLMQDPDRAVERLASLKALGVRIAIDDFGTGYCSLAYLRRFSVNSIKIDRAFISAIATADESAAIVHSLVQLGKTLGLQTLGEGIEDVDQLQCLQREECELGQGFLLAYPLNALAIEEFFEKMPSLAFPVPNYNAAGQ